jgi:uroporphyrin-III C-methyltransferase/precorrin-2 dehydrogenase/sirohydrochlorin ferrochelatase
MAQETINRILIREASRGHHVVRLKGGDPFVLGRGGEEAVALASAGIRCEVIPGVSSAIAAPALAGIPVTHRGLSAAFTVVSGHAPSAYEPVLTSLAPGSATLVVLMGLGARADIADVLMRRGWQDSTPVAILCAASTPDAWTWIGTLDGLGAAALPASGAGILVIGQVVALAAVLGPGAPGA